MNAVAVPADFPHRSWSRPRSEASIRSGTAGTGAGLSGADGAAAPSPTSLGCGGPQPATSSEALDVEPDEVSAAGR